MNNKRGIGALSAVTLTACVAVSACGGTGGGTGGGASASAASGSGTNGAGGGGSKAIACDGAPTALALGGTWAAYGKLAVSLQGLPGGAITPCPGDQVGESTMLLLLTMKPDPTDPKKLAEVVATMCSIQLPTVSALVGMCDPKSDALVSTQIVVPQSLLDALPKVTTKPVKGSLDGTAQGAALSLERFTVTVASTKSGAMLPKWDTSNVACDSTSVGRTKVCETMCVADCASVTDVDADGNPGVTVEVCGYTHTDKQKGVPCNAKSPDNPGATLQGKAFIDLEVNPLFTGTAKSSCEIAGTVDSKVLYNLLGADVWLAGSPITVTQAINSLPGFQVDPKASKFRMVRIDGKYGAPDWKVDPAMAGAACAELLKHVNEL